MDYITVKEEFAGPVATEVIGSIPSWVDGSLFRNGPGQMEVGDTKYNHIFDGLAKINKFTIKDGQVNYQSKFIDSKTYQKNMAANRIVVSEFGTRAFPDPCKSLFSRVSTHFKMPAATDNTLVSIYPIGDQLYTLTEGPIINRLNKDSLETTGTYNLAKVVSVQVSTAHPHVDRDGTMYNLGMMYDAGKYAIIKMGLTEDGNPVEKAEVVATVNFRRRWKPSYAHSFAITENYFVIVEGAMVIDLKKIMAAAFKGTPFDKAMVYLAKERVNFHIVDRKTGKKVNSKYSYQAKGFLCFHHANAYEENGEVVVDLCAFTDGRVLSSLNFSELSREDLASRLEELPAPQGRRYILPLDVEGKERDESLLKSEKTAATAVMQKKNVILCTPHVLATQPFEFPRYNYEHYNGKKYKHIYALGQVTIDKQELLKVTCPDRQVLLWGENGCYPSEPVFVPRPGAVEEDDGVVLSVVLDNDRKAFLLVLDASSFQELARASVPVPVHKDFHGDFMAASPQTAL